MLTRSERHEWAAVGLGWGWPGWVFSALALASLGFFLAPGSLAEKLAALVMGICPQRPGHSIFLGGTQLPLEARMVGIFAGFLIGWLANWLTGRGLAGRLGRGWVLPLTIGLILPLGADGLNALARDVRLPTPYPPNNDLRLLTGLLAGFGLSVFLTPIVASIVWHRPSDRVVIAGFRDLWPGVAGLGTVFLATRSGWSLFYYPVSLLAVAGVIAVLGCLNVILLLVVTNRDGRISRPSDLLGWLGFAAALAILELIGLGLLRWWATATLGLRWEGL